MIKDVYIIGVFSTQFKKWFEKSNKELVRDTYLGVLQDAGMPDGDGKVHRPANDRAGSPDLARRLGLGLVAARATPHEGERLAPPGRDRVRPRAARDVSPDVLAGRREDVDSDQVERDRLARREPNDRVPVHDHDLEPLDELGLDLGLDSRLQVATDGLPGRQESAT